MTCLLLYLRALYCSDVAKRAKDGRLDAVAGAGIISETSSALVACFLRFHNYIANELAIIDEPSKFGDLDDLIELEERLFVTARSVTCGLFTNIVRYDLANTGRRGLRIATLTQKSESAKSGATDASEPSTSRICRTFPVSNSNLVTIITEATASGTLAEAVEELVQAESNGCPHGHFWVPGDFSPTTLTAFGFNEVESKPDIADGGCMYKLLMRALPGWYRGDSVYAHYPLFTPEYARERLRKRGYEHEYNYERPRYIGSPITVKTWQASVDVLKDAQRFKVLWGKHIRYLTGRDFMLSGDTHDQFKQRKVVSYALYETSRMLTEISCMYEGLTTKLIKTHSKILENGTHEVDIIKFVGNLSHAQFVAQLFYIPVQSSIDTPDESGLGETPKHFDVQALYNILGSIFEYVFFDLDNTRTFELRRRALAGATKLGEIVQSQCELLSHDRSEHMAEIEDIG